jgi:hypothetical protein
VGDTIDIARIVTKRWFFIARYRDAELRKTFRPQYGINLSFVYGAVPEIVFNVFLHRYAMFVNAGRRYSPQTKRRLNCDNNPC